MRTSPSCSRDRRSSGAQCRRKRQPAYSRVEIKEGHPIGQLQPIQGSAIQDLGHTRICLKEIARTDAVGDLPELLLDPRLAEKRSRANRAFLVPAKDPITWIIIEM